MTNLQAINLLKGLEQSLDDYCELNDEGKTAFGMAITALELFGNSEQLPSAQPKKRTEERMETHTCDLISRQAAIDFVDAGHLCNPNEPRWSDNDVVNFLESRPPAQQWIQCSERLPSEKDGQVLVTKRGEVRIATYSEFSGTWYAGEMCAVGGEDPIAWTPLPEPYKNDYCSFGERAKE